MSGAATQWAWQQALKPTSKLVLLALADRANDAGECWPSTARLTKDTGLYRETIHAAIQQMEAEKIIQVSRANGRGNVYKLLIQPGQNQSEKADQSCFADQSEKADSTSLVLPPTTSRLLPIQNLKEESKKNLTIKTIVKSDISKSEKADEEAKPNPTEEIFEFWQTTMNHPQAVFDTKRKSVISKALKSYDIEQLKAAITGCAKSAWHMGQNDKGKVYDSLDLIFRSADKIEGFIQNSTITPQPGVTSHATKRQQSTAISDQIFSGAARVYDEITGGVSGDRCVVLQDDRYLPQPMDRPIFD